MRGECRGMCRPVRALLTPEVLQEFLVEFTPEALNAWSQAQPAELQRSWSLKAAPLRNAGVPLTFASRKASSWAPNMGLEPRAAAAWTRPTMAGLRSNRRGVA